MSVRLGSARHGFRSFNSEGSGGVTWILFQSMMNVDILYRHLLTTLKGRHCFLENVLEYFRQFDEVYPLFDYFRKVTMGYHPRKFAEYFLQFCVIYHLLAIAVINTEIQIVKAENLLESLNRFILFDYSFRTGSRLEMFIIPYACRRILLPICHHLLRNFRVQGVTSDNLSGSLLHYEVICRLFNVIFLERSCSINGKLL